MLSPEEVQRRMEELEKQRALKRRKKQRKIISAIILLSFGIFLMVLTAYYSYHQGLTTVDMKANDEQRLNVLFIGIDQKSVSGSRADTIMLVSLNLKTGEAGVLAIPRDTRVYIPERNRWDRINAAHVYGGTQLVAKTVSEFLGVPINYYIQTDFEGFSKIVDTLGGIEIDVERDMQYDDYAQGLHINLTKGLQGLDGDKALQYVRFRDSLGDVSLVDPVTQSYGGRIERQRKFVTALIRQTLRPATIPKLPKLVGQIWDTVETNIPWNLALKLAFSAEEFELSKMTTAVVPGNSDTINGAAYWIPDRDKLETVVNMVVYGKEPPLTVEVLNGAGVSGLAGRVGEILRQIGYDPIRLSNADHFNYPVSQLIVGPNVDLDQVKRLSEVLEAEIIVDPKRNGQPDITLIIGKNYQI